MTDPRLKYMVKTSQKGGLFPGMTNTYFDAMPGVSTFKNMYSTFNNLLKPQAARPMTPPTYGAPQSQQQGGQAATTSGRPLNSAPSPPAPPSAPSAPPAPQAGGDFLSNIKGMFLPRSGSARDMGQWLSGGMGRALAPMLGIAGPMGLPALSWFQQMMDGDTSRWETLTRGK